MANVVEQAVVLTSDHCTVIDDIALEQVTPKGEETDMLMFLPFHESVEQFKRLRLREAITKAGGSKTKAAYAIQLQPTYLSRL